MESMEKWERERVNVSHIASNCKCLTEALFRHLCLQALVRHLCLNQIWNNAWHMRICQSFSMCDALLHNCKCLTEAFNAVNVTIFLVFLGRKSEGNNLRCILFENSKTQPKPPICFWGMKTNVINKYVTWKIRGTKKYVTQMRDQILSRCHDSFACTVVAAIFSAAARLCIHTSSYSTREATHVMTREPRGHTCHN